MTLHITRDFLLKHGACDTAHRAYDSVYGAYSRVTVENIVTMFIAFGESARYVVERAPGCYACLDIITWCEVRGPRTFRKVWYMMNADNGANLTFSELKKYATLAVKIFLRSYYREVANAKRS
jgi:hypothetical protein